jgi:hypothetical protein
VLTRWLGCLTVLGFTLVGLGFSGNASAQFTSFNDRSGSILEGNWQSCLESDGTYSERIYEGRSAALGRFELHMGPQHEFALFRGVQEEHRAHNSLDNLLRPYDVHMVGNFASQSWTVSDMMLTVTLAGGSREDCESWWIVLRPVAPPSE